MSIIDFIKLELKGWKKSELIGLIVIFSVILSNSLFLKDDIIAIIYAICGISYTIIAGKGKISCYLFGIISTLCYSYLSYKNGLYGNLALNMCYYLPMQIIGIFAWKKNLQKTTNEIIKTRLPKKEFFISTIATSLLCLLCIFILKTLGDSSPYFDSITTTFSILAMYLTVKRCIEQWLVWTLVNSIAVIMWITMVLNGSKTIFAAITWFVYLLLGVYFYIQWKKEIR